MLHISMLRLLLLLFVAAAIAVASSAEESCAADAKPEATTNAARSLKTEKKMFACSDYVDRIDQDYTVVEQRDSHYQEIDVYYNADDDDACLYLNNYLHTCASSRPHYHEVFVSYPAKYLPKVDRVIFIGGGDSMVLYEVLKYDPSLVVGLELDQQVNRAVFKHFGTQPHWDNDKVEWWYGDAATSLSLLPSSYYGSFDLVILDITTDVAKALMVNDELNIIEASMLLMKHNGIIVKNEDDGYQPGSTELYTNYAVDVVYHDVPLYCLQTFVVGSNSMDFLTAPTTDHGISNLYFDKLEHFDNWYNYGTSRAKHCDVPERPHVNDKPASGVLTVVDAIAEFHLADALNNIGLKVTSSKSVGDTSFFAFAEGYAAMTCVDHCALDLQLFDKLHINARTLVKSEASSAFRLVTAGMIGLTDTNVGPPSADKLCDPNAPPRGETVRKTRTAEDFGQPQPSKIHSYNLTAARIQYQSQRPIGTSLVESYKIPPFLIGEHVTVRQKGVIYNGVVKDLPGSGKFIIEVMGVDDLTVSGRQMQRKKDLNKEFMKEFFSATLSSVLTDLKVSTPHELLAVEYGAGIAVTAVFAKGTATLSWDGGSMVSVRIYVATVLDDLQQLSSFAEWMATAFDYFPRGLNVMNFDDDDEQPDWLAATAE